MLNTKHRYALLGLALSSFFALVQFRLIIMLFDADYGRAVDAALGVLAGKPHWRQFQARVLAPFLINVVSPLFPSFYAAHMCFSIVTLAVMGYLAWRLGWRIGANLGAAMLALFVFLPLGAALALRLGLSRHYRLSGVRRLRCRWQILAMVRRALGDPHLQPGDSGFHRGLDHHRGAVTLVFRATA
ncbi:MAG: hypothetical protein WB611_22430 [Stellaceae bacterium]